MLHVNGPRLWDSLMTMATIGATANGGVQRLALSAEDFAARAVLADWCHQAGMSVDSDAIGNLFARREGRNPQAAPVVMGSHLDSPPDGGRFDGSVGVLAALEVVRSLNDAGITTARPLEIVVWTNQQGSRFAPAMLGSAVFAGLLPLASAQVVEDMYGVSLGTALSGHSGSLPLGRTLDAYFELHIEQGPILERAGLDIGVVTGSQAICWLDATLEGQAAHAGTTPMALRKDALFAAAAMVCQLERLAAEFQPGGLVTVGQLQIARAARNSVPGQLSFSIDLRHPDEDSMHALRSCCSDSLHAIAGARGIGLNLRQRWYSPAVHFDDRCVEALREAARQWGYRQQDMVSGAGHDAIHLAAQCPSAMLFIPCHQGISHHAAENVSPEAVNRGANVLLNAVLQRSNRD